MFRESFYCKIITSYRPNALVVAIDNNQHTETKSAENLVCSIDGCCFLYCVRCSITVWTHIYEAITIVFIEANVFNF